MPRAPRRCPRCDWRFTGTRNTCPTHGVSPTSRASWSRAERRRRTEAIRDHVDTHGWWCPGYGVPPHASRDLTAAHRVAVVNDGTNSPLTVLCRSCNSREGT